MISHSAAVTASSSPGPGHRLRPGPHLSPTFHPAMDGPGTDLPKMVAER